jgi:hypothetical protein
VHLSGCSSPPSRPAGSSACIQRLCCLPAGTSRHCSRSIPTATAHCYAADCLLPLACRLNRDTLPPDSDSCFINIIPAETYHTPTPPDTYCSTYPTTTGRYPDFIFYCFSQGLLDTAITQPEICNDNAEQDTETAPEKACCQKCKYHPSLPLSRKSFHGIHSRKVAHRSGGYINILLVLDASVHQ